MKAEDGNVASFTVHPEEDAIPRGAAEHGTHSGTCGDLDGLPPCWRRPRPLPAPLLTRPDPAPSLHLPRLNRTRCIVPLSRESRQPQEVCT